MNKLFTVIKMALADALIYRVDILIFMLSDIARPFVFLFLWLAAISSGARPPLSQEEFVQYYLLAMIIGAFTMVWSGPFISSRIRSGRISPSIIRPFNYVFFDLGNNIGEKVLKFIYLIPVLLLLSFVFKPKPSIIDFQTVPFFVVSLINAFLINYLMDVCLGFMAFWTDESVSIRDANDLVKYVLSGWLFPLSVLPLIIQQISTLLPYRYTLSFPIEILMGKLSLNELIFGTVISTFWSICIVLITKMIWQKGLRKYSAAGA